MQVGNRSVLIGVGLVLLILAQPKISPYFKPDWNYGHKITASSITDVNHIRNIADFVPNAVNVVPTPEPAFPNPSHIAFARPMPENSYGLRECERKSFGQNFEFTVTNGPDGFSSTCKVSDPAPSTHIVR